MDLFLVKWLLAFSPLAVVLVLMLGFNWGGGRAGAAGWFTALLAALLAFGADARILAYSQAKAVLLSLNVLYIIWAALLHYHAVNEAGAIKALSGHIERFSADKLIQLLLFGWVFASFLQGVAGYGVPIAVVAPLLAGLGFNPVTAVAVPAMAHCWSVTFGSMGASFQALLAVTGLGAAELAPWSAAYLGLAAFACGLAAVHVHGGWRMIAHGGPALLLIGAVMAGAQYLLAISGVWTTGAFGASLAGLAASLIAARLPWYRRGGRGPTEAGAGFPLGLALSGYLILIAVVGLGELVAPVKAWLSQVNLTLAFPELRTAAGYLAPAGSGPRIALFGHGGALLTYAAVLSFLVLRVRGRYAPGAVKAILAKTAKSGLPTSLGIVTMVGFALIMDTCGMTYLLAEGISRLFGGAYPFFAPWIGLLGGFMTGSNTNSNVVFGALQQQTALLAHLSVPVILAAQTTGGALSSMIAPAKIIVGCSTVGLAGAEGPVLKATLGYGLVITGLFGLLTLLLAR